jgi:hypothetical protein
MSLETLFETKEPVAASQAPAEQPAPVDKETWAANKKAEREALYNMADAATEKVFGDPKYLYQYLVKQSAFGKMSTMNTLLVMEQMPAATYLRSYDDWQKVNRNVKRNQNGISVFEAGDQYRREDGTMATGFRVTRVFDVTQTYGPPIQPQREVPVEEKLKYLKQSIPVRCVLSNELPSDIGAQYNEAEKTLEISRELLADGEKLYRALALEAARFAYGKAAGLDYAKDVYDWQADCAASIICLSQGVTPRLPETIPDYLKPEASGLELPEMRAILNDIRQAAVNVQDQISKVRYHEHQRAQRDTGEMEK